MGQAYFQNHSPWEKFIVLVLVVSFFCAGSYDGTGPFPYSTSYLLWFLVLIILAAVF